LIASGMSSNADRSDGDADRQRPPHVAAAAIAAISVRISAHIVYAATPGGVTVLAINLSQAETKSIELPSEADRYTLSASKPEDALVQLKGPGTPVGGGSNAIGRCRFVSAEAVRSAEEGSITGRSAPCLHISPWRLLEGRRYPGSDCPAGAEISHTCRKLALSCTVQGSSPSGRSLWESLVVI
jgi:hypothetical protein